MNRKYIKISTAGLIILLLGIYYFPQSLGELLIPDGRITVVQRTFSIENGVTDNKTLTYEFLPNTDTYKAITDIFSKYSYHRNLRSMFNAGVVDLDGELSYDFYFDKNTENKIISITGTGEIIIDNHRHQMGFLGKSKQASFMSEIELLLEGEIPKDQSQ